MADDEQARNEQADREEGRQRERLREEARTRAHEEEPMQGDPGERLGDLNAALETHDYPTTTEDLVEAYREYATETQRGDETVEEVVASTDNHTFDSAADVRNRILGLIHRSFSDSFLGPCVGRIRRITRRSIRASSTASTSRPYRFCSICSPTVFDPELSCFVGHFAVRIERIVRDRED